VGQARLKDKWSNVTQALFDSFVGFKIQGHFLTLSLASVARLKSAIKSDRHLWSLAQAVRKRLRSR
jgi:CelD/BcsL family acetyltransferase involved in cellulose biosynthesis